MYNNNKRKYNKNNKQGKYPNKNRSERYDDIRVEDARSPKGSEGKTQTYISFQALRGLPKSGSSITPKVDPYTQVLPESAPYALLNAMNKNIGGVYGGDDNLDGGNIRQVAVSNDSVFLKTFDIMAMRGHLNYKYLPLKEDSTNKVGYGIAAEMVKAIDEIQSMAAASSYYALPINNYSIESSIPYPTKDPETTELGNPGPMYECLIGYQLFLQAGAAAIQNFNKFRMNMGEMMRMSWGRETPYLNSYFGLMQKKSFEAQWRSLSYCINGEYFDKEWLSQASAMTAITSRRAEALTEPLLEGIITHNLPTIYQLKPTKESSTPVFSLDTLNEHAKATSDNHAEFAAYGYSFATIQEMFDQLAVLMSVSDTLAWVRQRTQLASNLTEDKRFNMISWILTEINYFFGQLKPAHADLRTALDVLSRVGITKWGKIEGIEIVRDTNVAIFRNLTLEHMFQSLCSGSASMEYNPTTYRWKGTTPWNIYLGIPAFNDKSGGSFLTFSTKILDNKGHVEAGYYLPRAFTDLGTLRAINRLGVNKAISVYGVNTALSTILSRLKPLSTDPELDIRIPYPVNEIENDNTTAAMLSWALTKVLGFAAEKEPGATAATVNAAGIQLDSDLLCFTTFEVEDISNEMVTFARTNGPFVVNTVDQNKIGFLAIV